MDAFPFTRYGLLHCLSVPRDAIVRDKSQDKIGDKVPGAESTTSEPKGQEHGFAARRFTYRCK
jgi:hemolysin D